MKKALLLSALALALALPIFFALDSVDAGERCHCATLTTPTFTKVGATCLNARTKARDAARAAAVCDPEEPACGPIQHFISTCEQYEPNKFRASAYATFQCEFCIDIPDVP